MIVQRTACVAIIRFYKWGGGGGAKALGGAEQAPPPPPPPPRGVWGQAPWDAFSWILGRYYPLRSYVRNYLLRWVFTIHNLPKQVWLQSQVIYNVFVHM